MLEKWDNKIILSKFEKLLLYIKVSQMNKRIINEYIKGDEVLMKAEVLRELMEYEDSLMTAFNKEEEDAREQRLIQRTIQKETKISIAKNMLEAKLPIKVITSCTGLTSQQIKELY